MPLSLRKLSWSSTFLAWLSFSHSFATLLNFRRPILMLMVVRTGVSNITTCLFGKSWLENTPSPRLSPVLRIEMASSF